LDTKRPTGVSGVPIDKVDPSIAIPACEAAVRVNPDNPRMLYQLGRTYAAAKAYESARAQYEKADALGYGLATNNLASLYIEGLGMPKNLSLGISLYEKAANAGTPIAMNNLGMIYLNGSGVPKDLHTARRWFQKAAEAGHVVAMFNFAWIMWEGKGGPKDLFEARRWYQKAAELGEAAAMTNLGAMIAKGEGGPRNEAEAVQWYQRAAALGDKTAINNLALRGRSPSSTTSRAPRNYTGDSGWKRGYPPGYSPMPARRQIGVGVTGAPCANPTTPGC